MSESSSSPEGTAFEILLVDDSEKFMQVFERLLQSEFDGIGLHAINSGKGALALELARPPDLILLDIDLSPDESGLIYLPRLQAKWPQSLIAMVSIHDEPAYERAAREAGASAFISKWQLEPNSFRLTLQSLGVDIARYSGSPGQSTDGTTTVHPG